MDQLEISIKSSGPENVLLEALAGIKAIHFRPQRHFGVGHVFVDRQPKELIVKYINGGIDGPYADGDMVIVIPHQGKQ